MILITNRLLHYLSKKILIFVFDKVIDNHQLIWNFKASFVFF